MYHGLSMYYVRCIARISIEGPGPVDTTTSLIAPDNPHSLQSISPDGTKFFKKATRKPPRVPTPLKRTSLPRAAADPARSRPWAGQSTRPLGPPKTTGPSPPRPRRCRLYLRCPPHAIAHRRSPPRLRHLFRLSLLGTTSTPRT